MGEVYLAEDTQLHRKVALKTLPADLASNRDRMRRFIQEAQAAAALNHRAAGPSEIQRKKSNSEKRSSRWFG